MIVMNSFKPDIRVLKEAKTLQSAGYQVTVLAIKDNLTETYETIDNIEVIRFQLNPIHYRLLSSIKNNTSSIKRRSRLVSKKISRLLSVIIRKSSELRRKVQKKAGNISRKTLKKVKNRHGTVYPTPKIEKIVELQPDAQILEEASTIAEPKDSFDCPANSVTGRENEAITAQPRPVEKNERLQRRNILKSLLFVFHRPLKIFGFLSRCAASVQEMKHGDVFAWHAHDLNTLPIAHHLQKKLGGKLVYDSHELYTEITGLTKFERKVFYWMERTLIHKCDVVITVNDSIAVELQKRYRIPKPAILLNCPELKEPIEPHNLIRERLGIGRDTPIVLYQGGFSPGRGIENLVLASRGFRGGVLVLMGWGKIEDELRDLVIHENLQEKVYFLPPVPQQVLLKWSSSADIGVIPYRATSLNNYYTCPNKLFEYICAGIAIAGSAFPEVRKIIESYELGITFNPDDVDSITDAINRVLSSSPMHKAMRQNAQKASKELNWKCQGDQLLSIYSDIKKTQ